VGEENDIRVDNDVLEGKVVFHSQDDRDGDDDDDMASDDTEDNHDENTLALVHGIFEDGNEVEVCNDDDGRVDADGHNTSYGNLLDDIFFCLLEIFCRQETFCHHAESNCIDHDQD